VDLLKEKNNQKIISPKIATNKNAELNACVSKLCNYRARFFAVKYGLFFSMLNVKCDHFLGRCEA
jgi:hypothetical protein